MGAIQPTGEQIRELASAIDDRPVVMINLLKFKKLTGEGEPGRAAYDRYGRNVLPILAKLGARVIWLGSVDQVFIGTPDDRWDQVMLVEYPSRKAFMTMISDPDYQRIHRDREAALEDSALIASTTVLGGR
jgi:uncharacterized protein (DUF1330 family)